MLDDHLNEEEKRTEHIEQIDNIIFDIALLQKDDNRINNHDKNDDSFIQKDATKQTIFRHVQSSLVSMGLCETAQKSRRQSERLITKKYKNRIGQNGGVIVR